MKIILKIAVLALTILPAFVASAQHTYTVRETRNGSASQTSRLTSKKIIPTAEQDSARVTAATPSLSLGDVLKQNDVFTRLEIAGNVGTTGLGLELATPVTKWAKLRMGVDWMPHINIGMDFSLDSYLDGKVSNKFDRIQQMMHDMTGFTMDDKIEMTSKPTMTTFKLLVDVYPLQKNTHWHVTAGFFIGGNSIGTSINKMQEMPSLLTLNMYNRIYDDVSSPDFVQNMIDNPIFDDIYLDPEVAMTLQDKMLPLGRLGVHIGDFKDGTPYMMEPDKDGTVSAKAMVNRFRPYLGIGYEGNLSRDGKWKIGVDAGAQFWGGAPKVTTHEGVVLNDLKNIRGKVKDYMDLMKGMAVYPSIAARLSYTF